jgi:DNA-binding transcriptional LysR family regulator
LPLAPVLARFAADYPRIEVEMVTDDGLVDVVGQGFDAGIRFGESLAILLRPSATRPYIFGPLRCWIDN